ncbi:hypothetical protein [Salinibacter ruber]|uniref:hypothetical protein n=1 Tax=Salinibacter ruber TaxID=146919 RepID=UPI00207428F7|nr:hypothetical protein [Salinibacter ruber]
MFSVGQTIVLGLAGFIYVVGAAFLLGGRAVLNSREHGPSGGDGGQVVRPGTINGAPHFVPALNQGTASPNARSATGGTASKEALSPSGRAHPASSRAHSGTANDAPTSLRAPLCLN